MLIDSHCHLDFPELQQNLPDCLARAKAAGVDKFLTISTKLSQFDRILALVNDWPQVYGSIGIHPHHAATEAMWPEAEFIRACQHPKIIAIGEAGLDYHYDYAPRDVEAKIFRAHIAMARQTQLPLIVHTREADADTAAILRNEMGQGAFPFLLHCFTGGMELAQTAIELGGYVSFSGIITYKNADDLRAIAMALPIDRILVETDAPYLAPVPHRGKTNEPGFVRYTAEKLAEIRGLSLDIIARQTTANFYRLFQKAAS